MSAPNLVSAAFRLAIRGMSIFPLSPGTKIPLAGTHGRLAASVDLDLTRIRWKKNPAANIGIACRMRSGFWAVDVDLIHAGGRTLQSLIEQHEQLPTTVAVSTPSGGTHMWWSWPLDMEIAARAG